MNSTAELRALVVSDDQLLVSTFSNVLGKFDIDAQISVMRQGIPGELSISKFEAVVVDFDTIPSTLPILASVKGSPSNKNALIFAVATGSLNRKHALEQGANFIFERPFAVGDIKHVLRRAYNLMVRERRRYFRCAIEAPVLLRCASGAETQGTLLNVSSTGLAAQIASSFNLGQEVQFAFHLPGSDSRISGSGQIVWDDKHGKSGMNFHCNTPEIQRQLDVWLDERFSQQFSRPHGIDQ